jgi:hypothetical protein
MLEENEQDKEAEALFDGSITENGVREVEIDDETPHKSRLESEAEASDISDLKATLNKLFPKIPYKIISDITQFALQSAMIARIAPDVFLDQMYLTVTDIVEEWDEQDDVVIDVQQIINLVYFLLSIGIDGKGRVDIIQVSANASETKESSSLGSALGIA